MTQTSFSLYQLVSPQQLMQGRQAQGYSPSAPLQQPLQAPQSSAAPQQLPDPSLLQRFSRVSSLLSPDQLQLTSGQYRPELPAVQFGSRPTPSVSLPGNRVNVGLTYPVDLFRGAASSSPALNTRELRHQQSVAALETMQPSELKALGQSDKKAFFAALLPAAIESEKKYGVPAELTLAQAALESGWAASPIGGYNIFGIKGSGPAGKTSVDTKEFYDGKWVNVRDGFAKYNNFAEAVERHGKLFHNGYYDKAVGQFAQDRSTAAFIDNIQGIYATDPKYSQKINSIIEDYGLTDMVAQTGMV
jgi:flagellum-specific peptidoglycan hydrolase FlgJ